MVDRLPTTGRGAVAHRTVALLWNDGCIGVTKNDVYALMVDTGSVMMQKNDMVGTECEHSVGIAVRRRHTNNHVSPMRDKHSKELSLEGRCCAIVNNVMTLDCIYRATICYQPTVLGM
jgi:deoxyinosine 3'endonuclease (endonuclease V)